MKNLKEILVPTIALFVICLVATALLGGTNELTADKIAQVAEQAAAKARMSVCEGAVDFQPTEVTVGDAVYVCYTALDAEGNTVGYAITTQDKSYGGTIEVMTGFDAEGRITGVEILTISDTPGLGMNAKSENFRNNYLGKSGELTVSKTPTAENEIQAITGATITSEAVTRCVNAATAVLDAAEGGAN